MSYYFMTITFSKNSLSGHEFLSKLQIKQIVRH
ncbi:MAG TPA: YrzI family small protein [Nitrosopumilus sp.]|nr:YrzI family small protein [Nitrosopumilus sp.]